MIAERSTVTKRKRPIRSALRPLFPSIAVFFKALGLVYSKRSALRALGYIESCKTKTPCRRDGSPIPWMNYQVIQFLEERLTKDLSLFEYGSGNSTSFYASLVKDVTSVEADEEWLAYVHKSIPSNVNLIRFDLGGGERYCELAARQQRKFDVIVIDAEDRVDCLREAPASLSDRGVIILDDSQREAYSDGIESALQLGFRKLAFEGLKPNGIRAYRTTVFYRDGNCLGI